MEITITVMFKETRLSLPMDRLATINDVKRRIYELENIDTRKQRLYACGKFLRGDFPLCVYDIRDGTNLRLEYDQPNLQPRNASDSSVSAVLPADHDVGRSGILRGNASTVDGLQHIGNIAVDLSKSGGSVLHQRSLKRRVSEGGRSSSASPVFESNEANPSRMAFDPPIEDGTVNSLVSNLEELHQAEMKLRFEVLALQRQKEDMKARLTQLLQIIGRLEEERAAMRSIHYVRIAEISYLKDAKKGLENELEEEKQKYMCQICFCRPLDTIIFPCSHFHFCFECLEKLQDGKNTCPLCRGPVSSLLKCHLSE